MKKAVPSITFGGGDPPLAGVTTGSISLDHALGTWGFPRGKIIEVSGPESCIDQDSFVQFSARDADGRKQNSKGGSIKSLWHKFHRVKEQGQGKWTRPQTVNSTYTAPCVNEDGRVFHGLVKDVIDCGVKECLKLTTVGGEVIIATSEHKFLSGGKFVELGQLRKGDTVEIHNNTPFSKEHKPVKWRPDIYLPPIHPKAMTKDVHDDTVGKTYTYSRIALSRAIFEAVHLNKMSLEEYKGRFKSGNLEGMVFLNRLDHVHHVDEDYSNNDPSNLVLLSASDHGKLHSMERHLNLRFTVQVDEVLSVEMAGPRQTYDIRMEVPFNNYVANRFVTHNSGKSALGLSAIAQFQKLGLYGAYIDAEQYYSKSYATALGVDDEKLIRPHSDEQLTGEDYLNLAIAAASDPGTGIIVIDSIAACVPKAELEGDMDDTQVGLQARMTSKFMRLISETVVHSNNTMVIINQVRDKIGFSMGFSDTTPCGRALKFYCSQRVSLRKAETVKSKGIPSGVNVKAMVIKNKCAPPFGKAEFVIKFGVGIDIAHEVLSMAAKANLVQKTGAYFSFDGERLGMGFENATDFLRSNPATMTKLRELVIAAYKANPVAFEGKDD